MKNGQIPENESVREILTLAASFRRLSGVVVGGSVHLRVLRLPYLRISRQKALGGTSDRREASAPAQSRQLPDQVRPIKLGLLFDTKLEASVVHAILLGRWAKPSGYEFSYGHIMGGLNKEPVPYKVCFGVQSRWGGGGAGGVHHITAAEFYPSSPRPLGVTTCKPRCFLESPVAALRCTLYCMCFHSTIVQMCA